MPSIPSSIHRVALGRSPCGGTGSWIWSLSPGVVDRANEYRCAGRRRMEQRIERMLCFTASWHHYRRSLGSCVLKAARSAERGGSSTCGGGCFHGGRVGGSCDVALARSRKQEGLAITDFIARSCRSTAAGRLGKFHSGAGGRRAMCPGRWCFRNATRAAASST